MRKIMHEDGYPGKLKCSVKISGTISNPIESRVKHVMRRGTIVNQSSQFICYADDMDIVGRTFEN
ncbi:conserved hypothetical protein [Culex quinquefasciatus]|uniref:Uncharacterized protein n=1 Tax=Culex quinquefasciatus TaxID=7176 RepID=B0WV17_CULQU|nr:conserved hypothetical protein [Culex quinquefasciatus]|eukprot:XP_001871001.1 conserved hypothetical protein [Culex quinquefasciatus]